MSPSPILNPWLVAPLAAVAMLAVAAHLVVTERRPGPESRRRIRMANAWVWLIAIPLIAAGASLIAPRAQPRLFTLAWMAVVGLVFVSVCLAFADIANTLRLAARARRSLQGQAIAPWARWREKQDGSEAPQPENHG